MLRSDGKSDLWVRAVRCGEVRVVKNTNQCSEAMDGKSDLQMSRSTNGNRERRPQTSIAQCLPTSGSNKERAAHTVDASFCDLVREGTSKSDTSITFKHPHDHSKLKTLLTKCSNTKPILHLCTNLYATLGLWPRNPTVN